MFPQKRGTLELNRAYPDPLGPRYDTGPAPN